ncbi:MULTISPECIES: CAF17-like 4Fe-4S cluster assembly/insertion protein YgfZ [Methylomonas]|uniref:CAF17-like 4Fe-4S cluster assembly/insertion protein YgfZ n=1 Tax=Methylomonas TaxID=416 RepID=UPI001232EC4F|nr:folate-binding protein YgfZ [Methylomonas rhizoryzae]
MNPANSNSATYYPLRHFAVIEITGADAESFLQGQLTCNVKEIDSSCAGIAGYCNPQGRVISTVLLVKSPDGFLAILPRSLAEKVSKRLQMYVLRSRVNLAVDGGWRLFGCCPEQAAESRAPADRLFPCHLENANLWVCLPGGPLRYLILTKAVQPISADGDDAQWGYWDVLAGVPWFGLEQSEQFIPQMLNLDRLGGVSFTKGCYTGQEIVARTHYLGKSKRALWVGRVAASLPVGDYKVLASDGQTKQGDVLAVQSYQAETALLMVLQSLDEIGKQLILSDQNHTPVTVVSG